MLELIRTILRCFVTTFHVLDLAFWMLTYALPNPTIRCTPVLSVSEINDSLVTYLNFTNSRNATNTHEYRQSKQSNASNNIIKTLFQRNSVFIWQVDKVCEMECR